MPGGYSHPAAQFKALPRLILPHRARSIASNSARLAEESPMSAPMSKHTVIIPVQFALRVEMELVNGNEVKSFAGSFHPVRPPRDDEESGDFESDVWQACLEDPATVNGEEVDGPNYLDQAKDRLAMELGRILYYENEQKDGEADAAYAARVKG